MYCNLSNVNLRIKLPSGNAAIYSVEPQHVPRDHVPESRDWPQRYGHQIAHSANGHWFKPGGWEEITDLRTIALLERCPDA